MSTHKNTSDVARLLQQIDEANEAAYQALYGLAAGIARHDIISAKMEYIGRCHEQLAELVGKDEAPSLVCQVIEQSGERHGQEKDGQYDENLKGGRALIDPTYTDLLTHFQQRLSSVGGEFHQVASLVEAAAVIAAHPALITGEIVVPPNFGQQQQWGAILPLLSSKGITIREAGSPASVADAPAGLSGAELAIAETGSVLLAENNLETRVVSMLTLTHFVLVSQDKLVPLLDDAVVILQQLARVGSENQGVTFPHGREGIERVPARGYLSPRQGAPTASSPTINRGATGPYYMSFVTGPSRTADIERTLTIGVQGPKTLCVILVADKEGAKP